MARPGVLRRVLSAPRVLALSALSSRPSVSSARSAILTAMRRVLANGSVLQLRARCIDGLASLLDVNRGL